MMLHPSGLDSYRFIMLAQRRRQQRRRLLLGGAYMAVAALGFAWGFYGFPWIGG
jgi:hypothetical protein